MGGLVEMGGGDEEWEVGKERRGRERIRRRRMRNEGTGLCMPRGRL